MEELSKHLHKWSAEKQSKLIPPELKRIIIRKYLSNRLSDIYLPAPTAVRTQYITKVHLHYCDLYYNETI